MPISITPQQTYVNQTATADIDDRHYDLDYQIQMAGGANPTLSYLNATFQYGEAEGDEPEAQTLKSGTLTWGQGMLQLPRAIEWDPALWQNLKDFAEILASVEQSLASTMSLTPGAENGGSL